MKIFCAPFPKTTNFFSTTGESFNCDELARPMTAGEISNDVSSVTIASNQKSAEMISEPGTRFSIKYSIKLDGRSYDTFF